MAPSTQKSIVRSLERAITAALAEGRGIDGVADAVLQRMSLEDHLLLAEEQLHKATDRERPSETLRSAHRLVSEALDYVRRWAAGAL